MLRQRLRPVLIYFGIALLAVAAGVGSAALRIRHLYDVNNIAVGPWRTTLVAGSAAASALERAVIASNELLALTRDEALYYVAETDSQGAALDGRCQYRVEGQGLPARWWSLSAYAGDRYLIRNPQHRYSVSSSDTPHDDGGRYTVHLGGPAPDGAALRDWIALNPGRVLLMLRLYNPQPALRDNPAQIQLPVILRERCA